MIAPCNGPIGDRIALGCRLGARSVDIGQTLYVFNKDTLEDCRMSNSNCLLQGLFCRLRRQVLATLLHLLLFPAQRGKSKTLADLATAMRATSGV